MQSLPPATLLVTLPWTTFTNFTVESPLHVTTCGVLPTNSNRVTCLLCALLIVLNCSPSSYFHTLMVLSAPALARYLPSACQPTSSTWCVWPSNDLMNLPLGSTHTLTNLSALAVAIFLLSGLKHRP